MFTILSQILMPYGFRIVMAGMELLVGYIIIRIFIFLVTLSLVGILTISFI